jgi:FkbM family methyltransferase
MDPDKNGETWLLATFGPRLETVFDVGANIGDWSHAVLQHCPRLRLLACYEPADQAVERLLVRRFPATSVSIVQAAVSDSEGTLPYYELPGAGPTSSLVANWTAGGSAKTVRCVTVDCEMDRLGLERLDLLKSDVEGYDLHVLRGAFGALSRQAIGIVQFEYNHPWMYVGSTLQSARALLDRCDYELFLLNGRGLCRCDVGRLGELFAYLNFVALPRNCLCELDVTVHPDLLWG